MGVTMRDIAKYCGLSVPTVSQVLNGRSGLFAEDTVTKVQNAAKRLGYRKNFNTVAMKTRHSGAVALLMDPIFYRSHTPMRLLQSVQVHLSKRDYHLIVDQVQDEQIAEMAILPKVVTHQLVDGLLINYHIEMQKDFRHYLSNSGIPSVWMNAKRSDSCVYPEERQSVIELVAYFIDHGYDYFIYIDASKNNIPSHRRHYSREDRFAGFEDAMERFSVSYMHDVDSGCLSSQAILDQALRSGKKTAIIFGQAIPQQLRNFWVLCIQRGIIVGEDLAFATFGSDRLISQLPLVQVIQNWRAVSKASVSMLFSMIEKRDLVPSVTVPSIIEPTELLAATMKTSYGDRGEID